MISENNRITSKKELNFSIRNFAGCINEILRVRHDDKPLRSQATQQIPGRSTNFYGKISEGLKM